MQLSPSARNGSVRLNPNLNSVPSIYDSVHVHDELTKGQTSPQGLLATVNSLAKRSPFAFYKGFGPVFTGIIPKMGVRFTSFEAYKSMLAKTSLANPATGKLSDRGTFLGELPLNPLRSDRFHFCQIDH